MTFPTRKTTGTGTDNNPVTSRGVQLPAEIASGDLVLVHFVCREGAAVTWDQVTAGTWTLLHDDTDGYVRNCTYARFCSGAEAGLTLTIGSSVATRSAWHIPVFSGASAVECGVASVAYTNQPNPPNLNPAGWGTEDTTWIATMALREGLSGTPNVPGGFTVRVYNQTANSSGGVGMGSAYRDLNAASLDPGSWSNLGTSTSGTRRSVAQTFAIRGGGAIQQPNRTDLAVNIYAPTLRPGMAPARLDVAITIYDPQVGVDQISTPARADIGVAVFEPQLVDGLGPNRVDVGVTIYAPVLDLGLRLMQPDRVDGGVRIFKPTLRGGTRTPAAFNRVAFGPFSGALADAALYSGSSQGAAFQSRWAVRGPIGFSDFQPFIAGTYEFDEAIIWLRMLVEPVARVFAITRDRLNVDVPDVIDRGQVAIPLGGVFVPFGRSFYQPPEVVANVVAAEGVDTVPRTTVRDDVTAAGFFVTCHFGDDVTNSVAATIKYIATGY